MLRICRHADARAFLARAEAWLLHAEIEHPMALQSARFARTGESHFQKPLYWATVEEGNDIVGCAYRTPPYRLGLTALPAAAVPALLEDVAAVYGTLSGVAGPEPTASEFAAAWTAPRGLPWLVRSRQRLLAHRAIVPSSAPRGTLRYATDADAVLARQWGGVFARESGIAALDGALCVRLIHERRLYFWDDGAPRCMVGVLRETRDASALGIIYTPPELRERGYATAAVAAFSRHLLERGLKHSYLYIDPGNAAAHAVCLKLGYAFVQDAVDIDFG